MLEDVKERDLFWNVLGVDAALEVPMLHLLLEWLVVTVMHQLQDVPQMMEKLYITALNR